MKRGWIIIGAVAVFLIIVLAIAFAPRRYEATFYPMGGIPFKVVAYGRNYIQFDRDMTAVENRVLELDRVFNRYDKASEISKLNEDAGAAMFWPGEDIDNVLELSRKWYRLTNGMFDPTVVPILDLWKMSARDGHMPDSHDIAEALRLVGLDKAESVDDGKIHFSRVGMALDFGAVAKGYIVDEAAKILMGRGVGRGVIEAGGDAFAFGTGNFRLGIQDPNAKAGEKLMGVVTVSEGAVVTSGDYERYFEIGGKKYSHIVDPRTGHPADRGIVSATVIGGDAADADALATSIMVLGLEGGIALVKELDGVGALIVRKTEGGFEVWSSKSLVPHLELAPEWNRDVREF